MAQQGKCTSAGRERNHDLAQHVYRRARQGGAKHAAYGLRCVASIWAWMPCAREEALRRPALLPELEAVAVGLVALEGRLYALAAAARGPATVLELGERLILRALALAQAANDERGAPRRS